MYEFVRGPLVWIAFIGFFGGMAYQFITMARLARKDKVVYPTLSAKYGLRSLLHWVVPFGGRNMQLHPVYTLAVVRLPLLCAGDTSVSHGPCGSVAGVLGHQVVEPAGRVSPTS